MARMSEDKKLRRKEVTEKIRAEVRNTEKLMESLKVPFVQLMDDYANGASFVSIAEKSGLTKPEFWNVIRHNPEYYELYTAAKEFNAHVKVDEARSAAEAVFNQEMEPKYAEQKIKVAMWEAERTKTFSSKQTIEHTGTVTHVQQLDDEEITHRLQQLLAVSLPSPPPAIDVTPEEVIVESSS